MKRKWIVVAIAACAIALAGCKAVSEPEPVAELDPIAVESVTLNATTLTLAPGDTRKLTATVKPDNADDKTVKWSSSDTAVATVDDDGAVKAINEGTATITAQAGGKNATCEVTVKLNPIAVESVTLDVPLTLTLAPGATRKLTATVNPENADDKAVTWSSSDTAVAVVGSDGTVVAIKEGTAIITAQAGGKTAICVVTVKEGAATNPDSPVVNPDSPVAVEGVTLNAYELTIEPNKTKKLQATVMPSNANDKTVTWSSSSTSVATVGDDGTVTAHAEGTATIYAYAGGKEAACTVTVKTIDIPVEDITLSETTLTLILTLTHGETKILKATVTPDNADDPSVIWWSSEPSVATVDNDGKVTAVNVGSTYIYAQAGEKMMYCVVNVEPKPVESVTLDKDTLVLMCGEKWKLNATITPNDAYYRWISWWARDESSTYRDSEIVTVDDDGTVTALKEGTATVYVQASGITAECKVTVKIAVESVTISNKTLELHPDERGYLTAYVTPYNADDKTVTWSSSDTSVATVTANSDIMGYTTIAALKEGKATITASAGGKKATCAVTVSSPFVIEGGVLVKYNGSSSTVSIPDGVTQIGSGAFGGCLSLTTVTIPTGVTSIGDSAFKGCTYLTTVNIPASVTNIAYGSFNECNNIKTVTYGGTLAQWCSLQNDYNLIYNASSVVLGDGTDLKTLTKLEIPAGVQYIGVHAFSGCKVLKSVNIPESVQYIGEYAFSVCTALESVDIPDSVTDIGMGAFSECKGLKTVTISKNVSSIAPFVFASCESLTSVTIPAGVKNIEYGAFIDCSNLTDVTIPDGMESIGESVFARCYKLTGITIPNGVKSIGDSAFQGCLRLANMSIPATVNSVGRFTFPECSDLVVYYGGTKSQWDAIKGIDIILLVKGTTIRCTDTAWFVN